MIDSHSRDHPVAFLVILAFLVAALTWRIADDPPWFDEGIIDLAAATLAGTGAYGLPLLDGFVPFDPGIAVGPTVVAPAAAIMAVTGPNHVVGRLVVATYAVAVWLLAWALLRRLVSRRAALLSLGLLVIGTPQGFLSLVFSGRQVIGEVPALAWCLAGYLALSLSVGMVTSAAWVVIAGACFGAALLTKTQLVFVVLPALLAGWLVDRRWHRQWAWWAWPVMTSIALALSGAWALVQYFSLGPDRYAEHAAVLGLGLKTQVVVFDPMYVRRAIGTLVRGGFVPFGVAGLGIGGYLALERNARGALHAQLLLLAVFATSWYVLGSIGWGRYGFYSCALATLWLGVAMEHLDVRARTYFGSPWAGRVLVAAVLVVAIAMASPVWRQVLSPTNRGYDATKSWLLHQLPPGTVVETWETELMLDQRLRFSYPGARVMFEATRRVMGGRDTGTKLDYDPLARHPDYLVQGRFGGWTGIYADVLRTSHVSKVAEFGEYVVYRVRKDEER